MTVPRSRPLEKRRRSLIRFFFTITVTTTMIATGAFGALPDNPLTQTFQQELGQNLPEVILAPVNSVLENVSAPTIQPQAASPSKPDHNSDTSRQPSPTISLDNINTAIVEFSGEMTLTAEGTATALATLDTATSPPTSTEIPTLTAVPSGTSSPTLEATSTPVWVYVLPTKTRKPSAPKKTATPAFIGFTYNNVLLNGSASPLTITAGSKFTVTYTFNIFNDPCVGCITQLVTGLGTAGTDGGTCAYNGIPGATPGVNGSENVILAAPVNPGTYNVVVVYEWQNNCAAALTNYPNGATPAQTIGQIIVP